MAAPRPVRVADHLAHRADERGERAQAVRLRGAAAHAGERHDAVVDDDADLRVRGGRAVEDCRARQ